MSNGDITPREAREVSRVLEHRRHLIETIDFDRKMTELDQKAEEIRAARS